MTWVTITLIEILVISFVLNLIVFAIFKLTHNEEDDE